MKSIEPNQNLMYLLFLIKLDLKQILFVSIFLKHDILLINPTSVQLPNLHWTLLSITVCPQMVLVLAWLKRIL